jgi:molybdopterin/thiamine biosynthesis adenylyltransferase
MIVISQGMVTAHLKSGVFDRQIAVSFVEVDKGDAFVSSDVVPGGGRERRSVNGLLRFENQLQQAQVDSLPAGIDVLVIVHMPESEDRTGQSPLVAHLQFTGWVRREQQIEARQVQAVPVQEELFSRVHGLYETDVLKTQTALIIGVGSGGSTIAIELAKAGVGNFILVDHDRLEIVNVVRHVCGISDLGRFKTKAVRDLILEKNPFANVETHQEKCDWNWRSQLEQLVKRANIVFCCTDNRPSRMLVNEVTVAQHRTCIYGGTFRRAYGGQVLRVIPGQTMCYQCFISMLPEVAEDQEIASPDQAMRIAYADRPVAVEPGLATDIAPISLMCVKLGILEMLRGAETTLSNLYEDLASPWFQWLNRREIGTDYAQLPPLESEDTGLRILAWYGINNERDPHCAVCGNFVEMHLAKIGKTLTSEEIDRFGATSDQVFHDEQLSPPSPT